MSQQFSSPSCKGSLSALKQRWRPFIVLWICFIVSTQLVSMEIQYQTGAQNKSTEFSRCKKQQLNTVVYVARDVRAPFKHGVMLQRYQTIIIPNSKDATLMSPDWTVARLCLQWLHCTHKYYRPKRATSCLSPNPQLNMLNVMPRM